MNNILRSFWMKKYKLHVVFDGGAVLETVVKGRSYKRAIRRFHETMPVRLALQGISSFDGFRVVSINLVSWAYM